jgi:hypothetical protein
MAVTRIATWQILYTVIIIINMLPIITRRH